MCIGVSTPPPLSPLKSGNCPSPLFRTSPYKLIFQDSPHLKNKIFQWTPNILKFFVLTPYYLLKVTKFLLKIFLFEFLVMTDKNIFLFIYTNFLSLNLSLLVYFLCKYCGPLEKGHTSFPANPSKNWGTVKPPLSEHFSSNHCQKN